MPCAVSPVCSVSRPPCRCARHQARGRRRDAVPADRGVRPARRPATSRRRRSPTNGSRRRSGSPRSRSSTRTTPTRCCLCSAWPGAPRGGVDWRIRLEDGDEQAGRGERCALRLPGGLPSGLSPPGGRGGKHAGRDRPDRRAGIVPSAGRVALGRAQLGSDGAALRAAQRARLGHRRFHRSRNAVPRGRRARRRDDRHQPAARAVRGRAAPFQPVFAVEPRLARTISISM